MVWEKHVMQINRIGYIYKNNRSFKIDDKSNRNTLMEKWAEDVNRQFSVVQN